MPCSGGQSWGYGLPYRCPPPVDHWMKDLYLYGGSSCPDERTCYTGAGNSPPPSPGPCMCAMTRNGVCGCLLSDAPITMVDGTTKLAKDISVGDEIAGLNLDGQPESQRVVNVFSLIQPCVEIVHEKGSFVCSTTHSVIDSNRNQVVVTSLCADVHQLLGENLEPISILSIGHAGAREVYGFNCEPDHIFLSEGLVHHNAKPVVSVPPNAVTL